jgi:hypothetical protein
MPKKPILNGASSSSFLPSELRVLEHGKHNNILLRLWGEPYGTQKTRRIALYFVVGGEMVYPV